jgi:hypothetical protein
MKKALLIYILLISTMMLSACGGNAASASGTSTETQLDPNARELPLSTKLAIGTLKLEGTEFAVASDQAAELLPLWQVLNNLSSSDSAAPEETTAISEQIQETMTVEQLAAIEAMSLTGEDIFATMQELGLANAPQVNASGTPQAGGNFRGGQGPEGGFPPDDAPQGGGAGGGAGPGGGFGSGDVSPEQIATAQARRAEGGGGFGNRMLTPLLEAVIELLESKAGN